MKNPLLRAAATADVEDAYRWYERQREGLGEEFLTAVTNALNSVSENPERYPIVYERLVVSSFVAFLTVFFTELSMIKW